MVVMYLYIKICVMCLNTHSSSGLKIKKKYYFLFEIEKYFQNYIKCLLNNKKPSIFKILSVTLSGNLKPLTKRKN